MSIAYRPPASQKRPSASAHRRQAPARVRDERGAALFIITMTLMLLSGLGMWSIHSANLIGRASGYSRGASQAQYVAEMGLLSVTSLLSQPNLADLHYQAGINSAEKCRSAPGSSPYCHQVWLSDLDGIATQAVLDTDSLGPSGTVSDNLQGYFKVEMTSPRPALVPGFPIDANGNSPYRMVTLTSYGTVRPYPGTISGGDLCAVGSVQSTAENSAAGEIAVRAHALIGPVN